LPRTSVTVARLGDGQVLPNAVPFSWSYWAARQNHDPDGSQNERLFDQNRQLV
jgi:hypothetical protein